MDRQQLEEQILYYNTQRKWLLEAQIKALESKDIKQLEEVKGRITSLMREINKFGEVVKKYLS